jgi:DNA invertase Pin-like site-specific DNA recombinase
MAITLAYWRGLVGEPNPTSDFVLAQEFAVTMQLPPLQWVEEQEALHLAWSKRSLGAALTSMQQGDSLLVNRMLMLATSMDECCQIIEHLLENHIFFYALDALCYLDKLEHFPVWRHALAIFQQFQWDMRSDSTKQGIQKRRELGLPIGRPAGNGASKLDEYRDEIVFLLTHGATQGFIADRYGSSRTHLNNWLKRRGIRIPPGPVLG